MKKFLILLFAVFATPALAASGSLYNWTGFYLGIQGGGGWGDSNHINKTVNVPSPTFEIDGGLLGGTYGYNLQNGPWVFGFEGDISWSNIKKSYSDGSFCLNAFPCVTELRWFGTDRVRVGYSWDRLLVYGTLGIAYGEVEGRFGNFPGANGSNSRTSFVFGGGLEWAFAPNWSAKIEYLRLDDFGDKITYFYSAANSHDGVSVRNVDVVRVGLNYRFSAPVR